MKNLIDSNNPEALKKHFAEVSKNTVEFMNQPKKKYKEEVIKCGYMDLQLFTSEDGDNFFYIIQNGVEYIVNPTTLELEEVGQN